MTSNIKRAVTLTLLAGAASSVLAAKAPVTDLSTATSSSATVASVASAHAATNETDIQRLERLLQNRNRVQAQMQQQLDEMTQEISTLRGELERNSYNMDQMVQRQRELFIEIDKLRSQASVAAVAPAAKAAESTGKFSTNVDEQTAYQNAVDLILKKRDYAGAIAAFKQFQKDYPESTFAPNTHYWLGQLYFAKRQDSEAEASFKAVLAFKDSNKRADALVKLGDLAKRGNNATQAKQYYQQVVDEYPASSSAKVAKSNLK
ncbi:tol-pal system protein YbgF [Vibrio sp. ZSDZ65]|uniref:Cell division coordinator CpoB n=1 Tax=Vibrio qingdaonensis TaxID=2829491 RepID=A0A9X3CNB3_9VIBR|nr:tol-pal system protein YbgF [Vibrio qingdaonensis]MCW8346543.1 tol-pal system protein YbgF [Vibrio qingdaonensis]